jgi:hypothetical protein
MKPTVAVTRSAALLLVTDPPTGRLGLLQPAQALATEWTNVPAMPTTKIRSGFMACSPL